MIEEKLIKYINAIEQNGIKQHSKEWLKIKKYTIGGSSIGTILNVNPYESIRSIIELKVGLKQFNVTIPMMWGNLFEEVIKLQVESDKSIKIYGEDCFIFFSEYITYSPDGLGCIDNKAVLFEFKCPYTRSLKNKVPIYYEKQVLMGLSIIPLVEYGIYVEAVYRLCHFSDINNNNYIKNSDTDGDNYDGKFLNKGIIAVYNKNKKYVKQKNIIDLTTTSMVNTIISFINDEKLHVIYYSNVDIYEKEFDEFLNEYNYNAVGILPWKLLNIAYHIVEKEYDFIDKVKGKIDKIINFLKLLENETKFINDIGEANNEVNIKKNQMIDEFIEIIEKE